MFDLACFVQGNRKGKPLLIRPLIFSCFAVSLTSVLLSAPASAQVHGPGPSDPSLFDTVINLPADQITIEGRIGNFDGSATPTTQLNVATGGTIGTHFVARSGSEVNITGGTVSGPFSAFAGSEVNISGGNFRRGFNTLPGSYVELVGGEFELNGTAFQDPIITLVDFNVFTGVLADGSVLIFHSRADTLNGVMLREVPLPPVDTTPKIVSTDISAASPSGLRPGQTLTLQAGGALGESFSAIGATLNIQGGEVGAWSEVADTVVNISGGTVGATFDAYHGSRVNISGGSVGEYFDANADSEVNISGGAVGDEFDAYFGSVVNISGGTVGGVFEAYSGSEVNISGGSVANDFVARSGSKVNVSGGMVGESFRAGYLSEVSISGGTVGYDFNADSASQVKLIGGEYKRNGTAYTDSTITLTTDDVFTGTLADGSAFIFSPQAGDDLRGVMLTEAPLPPLDTTLRIVTSDISTTSPSGLRAGQKLSLQAGGVLGDSFSVIDATLNVQGGEVGDGLEVVGAVVNISGGTVGDRFEAYGGSTVYISGGSVSEHFDANSGSVVNISGGIVGDDFRAFSGSEVGLFGTEFFLDGDLLDSLIDDEPFTITDRGGQVLSGTLIDGSAFSFVLNDSLIIGEAYFDANALLTVTLVTPGNFDLDTDVDGSDFLAWQENTGLGNLADWQANYGSSSDGVSLEATSLPEPSAAMLLLAMVLTCAGSSRR